MARQRGTTRLFVPTDLAADATLTLAADRAHYLADVLRASVGDAVIVFNGRDGAWRATIAHVARRSATLHVVELQQAQSAAESSLDVAVAFALVKRAAAESIVQKATELGASVLMPMVTARSGAASANLVRHQAIAVAAAEQCGRLTVPRCDKSRSFAELLAAAADRQLLLADEHGHGRPLASLASPPHDGRLGLIIGPEGGFTNAELDAARQTPNLTLIDLGPRILRADTAAIAGLAVIQSLLGDWRRA